MIDVWEIIRRRTGSEYKDYTSIGLASELQVVLYSPWVLNPANSVMISTVISFEDLQNINICLRPVNMNGYAEAPG